MVLEKAQAKVIAEIKSLAPFISCHLVEQKEYPLLRVQYDFVRLEDPSGSSSPSHYYEEKL